MQDAEFQKFPISNFLISKNLTQERFHRLLDNPDLLATISYEEMKTLALTYPYAHNLRYLLALKAHHDEHPDADRMLATAATYSLDRRQLFYLTAVKIPVFQPMAITVEEMVLELKPIEVVQRELEALAPQPRIETSELTTEQESPAPDKKPEPVAETPASTPPEKPETPENQLTFKPVFSQPFALWIGRFNPPVLTKEENRPEEIPTEPAEEKPSQALSAQELAERSVAENKDVISETLARLLAKQGYRDKATEMYERLRLAFPDKSAYFAAEIEKLKK